MRRELRVFVWLLLAFVAGKIVLTAYTQGMSIDGGYYTDVARHVRDGLGLRSVVSPYHHGFTHFPHPTSVYPLWPLLYGYAARFVPLEIVAHWLPAVLFVVSLVGAFLLGWRLSPTDLFPERFPGFHGGHLLMIMLGLHREYWIFTSLPYTEGLAFALLTFFLWRALLLLDRRSLLSALELGAWLAALFLVRSQFIVVAIAVQMVLGLRLVLGPDRPRTALRALLALGVLALAAGVWLAWVRSFIPGAGLGTLLRFDQARVSDALHPIQVMVKSRGLGHMILDRLSGLQQAWHPFDEDTYHHAMGWFQWALPLGLPFMLASAWRSRSRLPELARGPAVGWLLVGLVGAGGLASVHLAHKVYNGEWYFHRRQAIIVVFAFYLALIHLLRSRRRLPYVLGVIILASSSVQSVQVVALRTNEAVVDEVDVQPPYDELVAWLNARAADEGPIVVALMAHQPQRLAWRTQGVGYHWFYKGTSWEDLLVMTDQLGARYVIFEPTQTKRWAFRKPTRRLNSAFKQLSDHPDGFRILVRR